LLLKNLLFLLPSATATATPTHPDELRGLEAEVAIALANDPPNEDARAGTGGK